MSTDYSEDTLVEQPATERVIALGLCVRGGVFVMPPRLVENGVGECQSAGSKGIAHGLRTSRSGLLFWASGNGS